jgi:dienelactone hydrolase
MRALMLAGLVVGAGGGAVAGEFETSARDVAHELVARDYAAVAARFDPTMTAALPVDKLRAAVEPVVTTSGKFLRLGTPRASVVQGIHVIIVPLVYERATWDAKIALDAQRKVAGLFLLPGAGDVAWQPPLYGRAPVLEAPITVGPRSLPGILTLPYGKGPFPAVVLVHGSGPHDADETIGPSKPFRDLALGLAARGIATVRYEKRTHAHPGDFAVARQATVKEETLDDAVAAVRLAAAAPAIDAARVWVAGHSLGGYLAPRIAAQAPEVAGLVILAGSTRPLEDLVVEQTRALYGAGSPLAAQAEAFAKIVRDPKLAPAQTVDMFGAALSGAYFLDLRRYDPARTAAGLRVPMLVLQGERDFQVRRADYDGWSRALAGRPDARMKRYPALNHLFLVGEGPPSVAEYQMPGRHVDPQVIADIADFVLQARPRARAASEN